MVILHSFDTSSTGMGFAIQTFKDCHQQTWVSGMEKLCSHRDTVQ